MNRPTPRPSQEGSERSSAPCQFPSREGLGVGSWSQCIRKTERRLSMNRKMPCLEMNKLRILGSWSQCVRKNERGLSMNPRVLPASCRQTNRRKALPARCRQHLGGAVSLVRGSWSQCMRKNERGLSMNRPDLRIGAWLGNAALKTHALQTLRDCRASPDRAKRLECAELAPAFGRARGRRRSRAR